MEKAHFATQAVREKYKKQKMKKSNKSNDFFTNSKTKMKLIIK